MDDDKRSRELELFVFSYSSLRTMLTDRAKQNVLLNWRVMDHVDLTDLSCV
ncbi:unnamed protein product [Arabidopsis lyrata]|nr:unnamed protein product [Arabidopsis lyrata]